MCNRVKVAQEKFQNGKMSKAKRRRFTLAQPAKIGILAIESRRLLIAPAVPQNQACFFIFLDEPRHHGKGRSQKTLYFCARAISVTNPNDFRRGARENAALLKIRILRDDGETIAFGILPYRGIVCAAQSTLMNMGRAWIKIEQLVDQARRKIFVEEKLQAFSISDLRSRSAANARQARISCSVK